MQTNEYKLQWLPNIFKSFFKDETQNDIVSKRILGFGMSTFSIPEIIVVFNLVLL